MDSIGDIATVTVHIKKIREKIETDTSKPQYIETIWGVGYRVQIVMMKSIIIYEDKEILVIHKPAGIATQTAKLGQADVVSELKNYLKQKGENTFI